MGGYVKMSKASGFNQKTLIIFFPFQIECINTSYIYGDIQPFNDNVTLFFATQILHTDGGKTHENILGKITTRPSKDRNEVIKNWIFLEMKNNFLSLTKVKLHGDFKELNCYCFLWIKYNFKKFSQCEILSWESCTAYIDKSCFRFLKKKVHEKVKNNQKFKMVSSSHFFMSRFLKCFSTFILKLSCSIQMLRITKYLNVALHIDKYLKSILWVTTSIDENQKLNIKIVNLLLSLLVDTIVGIFFLYWLNTKVSLDSSDNLFLLASECVVNSIKDLINWLKGDPGGLKLNWAFNNILATFFLFHIDIWWTFLGKFNPLKLILTSKVWM